MALMLCSLCAGRDQPFVNNYGVWTDEYSALGLQDTLDANWEDALCFFGQGKEVRVGRRCANYENQDSLNIGKQGDAVYTIASARYGWVGIVWAWELEF